MRTAKKVFRSTRLERELALARLVLVATLLATLVLSRNVDSASSPHLEVLEHVEDVALYGPKVSEGFYEQLGDACPDQDDTRFSF